VTEQSGFQLVGSGAEAYERYMVPIHCLSRAEDLLDRVLLRSGSRLIDVGCGTGVVSRAAARRLGATGQVTGVELNPDMLNVARRASAFLEGMEFQEGDACALPMEDESVDVVVSQHALMFIPDRAVAVADMRRVVKPAGRVAVSVFRGLDHNPHFAALYDALSKHAGQEAADFIAAAFVIESVDQMRELFEVAGWRDVEVTLRVETARYPSVERLVLYETLNIPDEHVQEEAVQAALVEEMGAFSERHFDDRGVVFPTSDYVVVARK
jgi:ubiquinone/menaquinone biosynthesis C-methylase UbiE